MFSPQALICCICGAHYEASVGTPWHAFDKGVCGPRCFYEKEWRRVLSTMGQAYRPDTRTFDPEGRPVKV